MPKTTKEWEPPPGDLLPGDIKKVIVLMLENRGFDHVMGWLYKPGERDSINFTGMGVPMFDGLNEELLGKDSDFANSFPPPSRTEGPVVIPLSIPPKKGALSPRAPSFNPGESFQHIMNQMWGGQVSDADALLVPDFRRQMIDKVTRERLDQSKPPSPPMNGYIRDYKDAISKHFPGKKLSNEQLAEIMETYTPAQLPVLSGLARFYGVSDAWFCSVPSQTNTNRAFSMAGTSCGLVNNGFYDPFEGTLNPIQGYSNIHHSGSQTDRLPETTRSIFQVLQQSDHSWNVYWQDPWPPKVTSLESVPYTRRMFPFLQDKQFDKNFRQFNASDPNNEFYEKARAGKLPALTWIEPKWGGGGKWERSSTTEKFKFQLRAVGNDYHPVSDTTTGEDFVMDVYKAVSEYSGWDDTLLIVTFDENGGTYDHFPPPFASQSGYDRVPFAKTPITMDPQTRTQFGFDFRQFGVRVPTLLISPRIPERTVFRSPAGFPFDHTSIIATILTLAKIGKVDWQLGERVANAPTFEKLLLGESRGVFGASALEALEVEPERLYDDDGDNTSMLLLCGAPYCLEYIGNPWGQRESRFLSATSTIPTLVAGKEDASNFKFTPSAAINAASTAMPLSNMSVVNIVVADDQGPASGRQLQISGLDKEASYGAGNSADGSKWQIRILNSRNPLKAVKFGDEVYFVSQVEANTMFDDPFHRLVPLDGGNKLATIAGVWGLWRIRAPNAPQPALDT